MGNIVNKIYTQKPLVLSGKSINITLKICIKIQVHQWVCPVSDVLDKIFNFDSNES
ncbi:hypothetical protein Hanom_Chr03g00221241 [Helianthus anomalus]